MQEKEIKSTMKVSNRHHIMEKVIKYNFKKMITLLSLLIKKYCTFR